MFFYRFKVLQGAPEAISYNNVNGLLLQFKSEGLTTRELKEKAYEIKAYNALANECLDITEEKTLKEFFEKFRTTQSFRQGHRSLVEMANAQLAQNKGQLTNIKLSNPVILEIKSVGTSFH